MNRRPRAQCHRPDCNNDRRPGYQLCAGCSDLFFSVIQWPVRWLARLLETS